MRKFFSTKIIEDKKKNTQVTDIYLLFSVLFFIFKFILVILFYILSRNQSLQESVITRITVLNYNEIRFFYTIISKSNLLCYKKRIKKKANYYNLKSRFFVKNF